MQHIMKLAREFRMDNPLVDFGNAPYQPKQPVNIVFDTWGIPAALIRGLFEYLYGLEAWRKQLAQIGRGGFRRHRGPASPPFHTWKKAKVAVESPSL